MQFADQDQCCYGAAQGQEHIPLRIPHISLRCKKSLGILTDGEGNPPFKEFIQSADGKRESNNNRKKEFSALQLSFAEKEFAKDHRGDKSLSKMSYAVIIISGESEMIAQPAEQRHFSVGVMTADHQNKRMNTQQRIDERGEGESTVGNDNNNNGDKRRYHFEEPSEQFLRMYDGPEQSGREYTQKE